MKTLTTTLLLLLACTIAHGQSKYDSNSNTMNKVKKSRSYIYAENTADDEETALSTAYELLEDKIEQWASEHSKDAKKVVATDVHTIVDTIYLNRADKVCAFVYVKKKNLIPIYSKEGITIVDRDCDEDTAQAEEADVQEEEEVEEETESAEEEEAEDPSDNVALSKIVKTTSFFDLKKVMEPLKDDGYIEAYGKYATMEDPTESYLIIYDSAGNIKAVLGKENDDEERFNLKTGEKETVDNYHGCGAIWFTLKK